VEMGHAGPISCGVLQCQPQNAFCLIFIAFFDDSSLNW
jgi:hypothetical protein